MCLPSVFLFDCGRLFLGFCVGFGLMCVVVVIIKCWHSPLPSKPAPLPQYDRLCFVTDKQSLLYHSQNPDELILEYWTKRDRRPILRRERRLAFFYDRYVQHIPSWMLLSHAHEGSATKMLLPKAFYRHISDKQITDRHLERMRQRRRERGLADIRGREPSEEQIPVVDAHHPGVHGLRPPPMRPVVVTRTRRSSSRETDSSRELRSDPTQEDDDFSD